MYALTPRARPAIGALLVILVLAVTWTVVLPPLFGREEADRFAAAASAAFGDPLGEASNTGRTMTVGSAQGALIDMAASCFQRAEPASGACVTAVP